MGNNFDQCRSLPANRATCTEVFDYLVCTPSYRSPCANPESPWSMVGQDDIKFGNRILLELKQQTDFYLQALW